MTFWTDVLVFEISAIKLGGRLTKQLCKGAKTTSTLTGRDMVLTALRERTYHINDMVEYKRMADIDAAGKARAISFGKIVQGRTCRGRSASAPAVRATCGGAAGEMSHNTETSGGVSRARAFRRVLPRARC